MQLPTLYVLRRGLGLTLYSQLKVGFPAAAIRTHPIPINFHNAELVDVLRRPVPLLHSLSSVALEIVTFRA